MPIDADGITRLAAIGALTWVEVRDAEQPRHLYGLAEISEGRRALAYPYTVRRVGPGTEGGLDAREWSAFRVTAREAADLHRQPWFRSIGRTETASFEWVDE